MCAVPKAVEMGSDEPLPMHPSPTKSPASRRAMIASLPILLMTVNFTAPDSMNKTVLAGLPCRKTVPGFSKWSAVLSIAGAKAPVVRPTLVFAAILEGMERHTVPCRTEDRQSAKDHYLRRASKSLTISADSSLELHAFMHDSFANKGKYRVISSYMLVTLLPNFARGARRWLFHLGGIGLIPLGLVDNSLIPLPGTMDVATLVLSASQGRLWLYYALMATAGSVIGGFVTYRLARHGGKETLDRRFSSSKVDKVCNIFGRWGFGAVAVPALLAPPVPMVPFLLAAGALQYPLKKFLVACTIGRISRYMTLAYFAARYGPQIIAFIAKHQHPAVEAVIVVLVATAALIFYFWWGSKS